MRLHPKWGKDGMNLTGKGFKRSLDSSGSLSSGYSEQATKRPQGRDSAKAELYGTTKLNSQNPAQDQILPLWRSWPKWQKIAMP